MKDLLVRLLGDYDEQVLRFGLFGALFAAAKNKNGKITERIIGFFAGLIMSVAFTPFFLDVLGDQVRYVSLCSFTIGYFGLKLFEIGWEKVDMDALLSKVINIKIKDNDTTDENTAG